jgi:hypothetical protein
MAGSEAAGIAIEIKTALAANTHAGASRAAARALGVRIASRDITSITFSICGGGLGVRKRWSTDFRKNTNLI